MFIQKRDGNLHLCIDYRILNLITKKNYYLLLLILEALDQIVRAMIFIKLDIQIAYNQI